MGLPQFLSISLLISMGVAPGFAQAPPTMLPVPLPNPFAQTPLTGSRIPAMDFRAPATNAAHPLNSEAVKQLNPRTLKRLNPFVVRPNDLYAMEVLQGPVGIAARGTVVTRNVERCYAIRDYQFSRVATDSDATRLSGSSTCEPARQVQLKSATALAR